MKGSRERDDQEIKDKNIEKFGIERSFTSYVLGQASLLKCTASYMKFLEEKSNSVSRRLSYNGIKQIGS